MRSLAEAFLGADDNNKAPQSAEQISGDQATVHARVVMPSSVAPHRTEASGNRLPIVALSPTCDGTTLARTLARALVRRALIQEGAFGVADDCANPTTSR